MSQFLHRLDLQIPMELIQVLLLLENLSYKFYLLNNQNANWRLRMSYAHAIVYIMFDYILSFKHWYASHAFLKEEEEGKKRKEIDIKYVIYKWKAVK